MECLAALLRAQPSALHDWQPREWLSLMLVCRQWRDYLYAENPLAIDWGWHNDAPLRFAARHGHSERVAQLLRNPVVNPAALDNAALMQAAIHGHTEAFGMLLAATPLAPAIEMLVAALARKHREIAVQLLTCGKLNLALQPRLSGLERQMALARHHRCSVLLVLAAEVGDYPELVCPLFEKTPSWGLLNELQCWRCMDQLVGQISTVDLSEFQKCLLCRVESPIEDATLELWLDKLRAADSDISLQSVFSRLLRDASPALIAQLVKLGQHYLEPIELYAQLEKACGAGHIDILRAAEGALESLQVPLEHLLLAAIAAEQLSCVEWLLALPQIDPAYNNNQAICAAAERGSLALVDRLVREPGVAAYARRNAPLRHACAAGSLPLMRLLLASSPRCCLDKSCFLSALQNKRVDALALILDRTAMPYEANAEIFSAGLGNEELMSVLCAALPTKLVIRTAAALRGIVELLLLHDEAQWLPALLDSRILLSEEIERIFRERHFDQVNRERVDLQRAALPFFRAVLGAARPWVSSPVACKMIFTLAKHSEFAVLIEAALGCDELMDSSAETREIFKAKVCSALCKCSTIPVTTARSFFKAVKFNCKGNKAIQRCKREISDWLRDHASL